MLRLGLSKSVIICSILIGMMLGVMFFVSSSNLLFSFIDVLLKYD